MPAVATRFLKSQLRWPAYFEIVSAGFGRTIATACPPLSRDALPISRYAAIATIVTIVTASGRPVED
jgi:hypothetical protein